MAMATGHAESEALPAVIPVFPLAGAVLLPRARLPLNIFENRYLAMVRDALDSDGVIGMVQPSDAAEPPALYDVGCLGRIESCSETPDGRLLITLAGLCRFSLVEELPATTPYRQVKADYAAYSGDLLTPLPRAGIDRQALLEALSGYLEARRLSVDWDAVDEAGDEALVHSLSAVCPFSAPEKQALLETGSLRERARTITTLMTIAASEPDDDGQTQPH